MWTKPSRGIVFFAGGIFLVASQGFLGLCDQAAWGQRQGRADEGSPQIIQQVDDSILSAEDLEEFVKDQTGDSTISAETKSALIRSLVRTKLFSRAARSAKLDASDEFRRAREEAREKILINAHIQRHVQPNFSEAAAHKYFREHKDDLKYFGLRRNEILAKLKKQAVAAAIQTLSRQWNVKRLEDLRKLDLSSADPDAVLVQVEDSTVTVGDLRRSAYESYETEEISSLPVETQLELLDGSVLQRLSLYSAERMGLAGDPSVRKAMASAEDQLLAIRYLGFIQNKVGMDDARLYYQAHPDEFRRPDQLNIRQILVATKEHAEAVEARLRTGEPFEEVAKTMSTDRTSALRGGDIGWVRKGRLDPPIESAAFALESRHVSAPIKTPGGYFIIRIDDRIQSTLRPFEEVAPNLLEKLRRAAIDAEFGRLKRTHGVRTSNAQPCRSPTVREGARAAR
ncbi:MAG: peptidyl-prolyl cis-trans isomerase [Acidobacteria bacterium]|nr:peptidyl-prolyl cis-trans isomerase [Acidobacteriota bacterium]